MGSGTDAGFIDVDYWLPVDASHEIVGNRFADNTILGCRLNISDNTIHNCENSCETILDNYQYKENDYQILKTEARLIMADLQCVTVRNDKTSSVDDALQNASNLGICDLFEQTLSNACLSLSKCSSIGSRLNIYNIEAGFTANKDNSIISNSTWYLAEAEEAITDEEVYKLENFVGGYDANLTDDEAMISTKSVKRIKQLRKIFERFFQSVIHQVVVLLLFDSPWIAASARIDNNFYHLLYI